jgi:hypothetical protein
MIKNILAVGDSFTYGEELSSLDNAYPYLLGRKIGSSVTNMAKPGSGNTRMIRYIMDRIAEGNIPDLVIIGWSSPGRMEFADESGFFDLWPGYSGRAFMAEQPWRTELLEYVNRYHDSFYLYKQYILNVILIQNFLNQQNIKYVMLKTVGNEYYYNTNHFKLNQYIKLIDTEKYVGWPNAGMAEWTQGCDRGPGGHFLDDGHNQVANKINEHIRNLGWLS